MNNILVDIDILSDLTIQDELHPDYSKEYRITAEYEIFGGYVEASFEEPAEYPELNSFKVFAGGKEIEADELMKRFGLDYDNVEKTCEDHMFANMHKKIDESADYYHD